MTKGSAPGHSFTVDTGTNRLSGAAYAYDSRGNMTTYSGRQLTYDGFNRHVKTVYNSVTEDSAHGAGADRVAFQRYTGTGQPTERVYFYGPSGALLSDCELRMKDDGGNWQLNAHNCSARTYFNGMRVDAPRDIRDSSWQHQSDNNWRKFPYGEVPPYDSQDDDTFATYKRSGATGLDYARNRTHAPYLGRFTSPDPMEESAAIGNPHSWNRTAYGFADPIGNSDPDGLDVDQISFSPSARPTCYSKRFLRDISGDLNRWLNSDSGTLALQVYFEYRDGARTPGAEAMWTALANVYRNRWHLSNSLKRKYGFTRAGFKPLIYQSAGVNWTESRDSHWGPGGKLRSDKRAALIDILNGDPESERCGGLIRSFQISEAVHRTPRGSGRTGDVSNGALFYRHSWPGTVPDPNSPFGRKLPHPLVLTAAVGPFTPLGYSQGTAVWGFFYTPADLYPFRSQILQDDDEDETTL